MRLGVIASVICCAIVGLSSASDVEAAAIKRPTNIPAQGLGPALQMLAKNCSLQVIYFSDAVDSLKTVGASGELTPDEAFRQLLIGTGLTFKYLDEKTVTIVPLNGTHKPTATNRGGASPLAPGGGPASEAPDTEAAKRGFWSRLHVAQAEQGASGGSTSTATASTGTSERKSSVLEEIIVTAQKREERLQDVPVPVTAISGEALAASNQLRLEDYYTRIPGLSLTTVQPFGSSTIAIRGVVTGYYQSPTVGIVVDDVPYTSSTTVGFGNAVSDFDPSDLSRVEVLRGPQGTLYGASSMGGLIKYVTVDPSTDRMTGRIQGGINTISNGNELGYSARGAVNVPLSDTFALRASAFTRRDPGYIDDPANGTKAVNWGQISGGRLSALWRPSDDVSLKLSALLQDSKVHGSAEVDAIPGLGDLAQDRLPDSGGNHKSFQVYSANLSAKLGIVELTVVSAYATNKNKFMWDFSNQLGGLARDG
ncbi:MAG: TonB-dependent receptor plug domain-containing protein, partial [Steroidobacteraceae bacterium]